MPTSSAELLLEMVGAVKRELRVVEQALTQAKEVGETSEEGRGVLLQAIKKVRGVAGAAEELGGAAMRERKKMEGP